MPLQPTETDSLRYRGMRRFLRFLGNQLTLINEQSTIAATFSGLNLLVAPSFAGDGF